jgi:putative glycosyltransferase (TIGR04348 family)
MKISLITPAGKRSKSGNRTTAERWAGIFRGFGHRVRVAEIYNGEAADMMVALHAWRSADSILRFRERTPRRPIVVALTGTDIYRFQQSHRAPTRRSMALADRLVCLHGLVAEAIPPEFAAKLTVIPQSAAPLPRPRAPSRRFFDICVLGHLRAEKDPLRAALAARDLPAASRLRVIHLGQAHDASWAGAATAEMARNPRYLWRGEAPGWAVRREFIKTRLMVISSLMEGGANVVSEAIVAGVPVIASDIPGNIGLLGPGYPGYYPCQDTAALRALLHRAETEPGFLDDLTRRCVALAPNFSLAREAAGWRDVLARLGITGSD